MQGRWLPAGLAAVALALVAPAGAQQAPRTIYSSLPLQGFNANQAAAVVRGERLALEHVGGRAGGFPIRLVSLDDEDPALLADYVNADHVAFVEWPDAAGHALDPRVRVRLAHAGGDARDIAVEWLR